MSKLAQLEQRRRRLDKKQSEVDLLKRQLIKDGLGAIFEALGITAQPGLHYLDHSSNGVRVVYGSGDAVFNVTTRVDGIELNLNVKDCTDTRLQTFKRLMEVK